MMGDAMFDAGGAVREAGHDAADAIRDATADAVEAATDTGGDVLEDTGTIIGDGASDDALAQEGCTTCTPSGAAHTALASEDPAQTLTGTITSATGRAAELAVGPLYVTDVSAVEINGLMGAGVGAAAIVVATVPMSAFCDDSHYFGSGATIAPTETLVAATSTAATAGAPAIHGGRLFVPAGRRLCAQISSGIGLWSAFRPYE